MSSSSVATPNAYVIPHLAGNIIYAPLRRLAFLVDRTTGQYVERANHLGLWPIPGVSAPPILEHLGLFSPQPLPPAVPRSDHAFLPTTCVLLMTTACNLRCIYCYAAPEGQGEVLDVALGRKAIDIVSENAKRLGRSHFDVSFHGGGEPTLAWAILRELTEYARKKRLPCNVSLTSNGVWSAERRREVLALAPTNVSLSVDGISAVQDRQRPRLAGGGSSAAVWETVQALEEHGVRYGIRASVTDQSLPQLSESIEHFCRNTRTATFQVEPVFGYGRALLTSTQLVDVTMFIEAFLDAYDIALSYGRHLYYSAARPWLLTGRFCSAPDDALIVSTGGGLTSCYEVYGPSHPLADQFFFGRIDSEGLTVVEDKRRRLLELVDARQRECRTCFCYYSCAGDCVAKVLSAGGHGHLKFGIRCEITRAITKELIIRNIETSGGIWRDAHVDARSCQLVRVADGLPVCPQPLR